MPVPLHHVHGGQIQTGQKIHYCNKLQVVAICEPASRKSARYWQVCLLQHQVAFFILSSMKRQCSVLFDLDFRRERFLPRYENILQCVDRTVAGQTTSRVLKI